MCYVNRYSGLQNERTEKWFSITKSPWTGEIMKVSAIEDISEYTLVFWLKGKTLRPEKEKKKSGQGQSLTHDGQVQAWAIKVGAKPVAYNVGIEKRKINQEIKIGQRREISFPKLVRALGTHSHVTHMSYHHSQ